MERACLFRTTSCVSEFFLLINKRNKQSWKFIKFLAGFELNFSTAAVLANINTFISYGSIFMVSVICELLPLHYKVNIKTQANTDTRNETFTSDAHLLVISPMSLECSGDLHFGVTRFEELPLCEFRIPSVKIKINTHGKTNDTWKCNFIAC